MLFLDRSLKSKLIIKSISNFREYNIHEHFNIIILTVYISMNFLKYVYIELRNINVLFLIITAAFVI